MKKKIFVSEYELPVKITPLEEGGYLARCEKLQGCMAEGKTIASALETITDVARQIIDIRVEEDMDIPLKTIKTFNSSMALHINLPLVYQTSHA